MQRLGLKFCYPLKQSFPVSKFATSLFALCFLSPSLANAASIQKIQSMNQEITIEDLIKLASFGKKNKIQILEKDQRSDFYLRERVNFYADELSRMPTFQLSELSNLEAVAKKNRVASNGSVYDVQAMKRNENNFNSDPSYDLSVKPDMGNVVSHSLKEESEEVEAEHDLVSIEVLKISNAIETSLDEIDINMDQQSFLEVSIADTVSDRDEIRLYSKSSSVLKADSTNLRFEVLSTGETEVVIASRDQAKFIKVHVGTSDDLSRRKTLLSQKTKLSNLNMFDGPVEPASDLNEEENGMTDVIEESSESFSKDIDRNKSLVDVGMSAVEAARAVGGVSPVSSNLVAIRQSESVVQSVLNLKVLDYRSDINKNLFYPVANAKVQITGLAYPLSTDAKGEILLRGIPENSILTARVEVPGGEYKPTVIELDMNSKEKVQIIYLMRYDYLNLLTSAASTVQNAFSGSTCFTVLDSSGKGVSGFDVKMDVAAQGPYYFNNLNYIDASLKRSQQDGRVCFFNIESGPYFVRVYKDEDLIFAKAYLSSPGYHDQSLVKLDESPSQFKTAAVAIADVVSQMDSKDPTSLYEIQDYSEIKMLANDEALESSEVQELVSISSQKLSSSGHYFINQTSEFETSLQRLRASSGNSESTANSTEAMLLLPRGFLAEMADSAMTKFDYQLGHVYVEFGQIKNMSEGGLSIKLLDMAGNRVGESWYFSDLPVSKNIFYNVEPGLYQVLVEDRSGAWLAAESVYVYNEAVSVLNLGSKLQVLQR